MGAFLVYWNTTQYAKERVELEQKLKDQLSLANGEIKDSIFAQVITIVTTDGFDGREFNISAPHFKDFDSIFISSSVDDSEDFNFSMQIDGLEERIDEKGSESSKYSYQFLSVEDSIPNWKGDTIAPIQVLPRFLNYTQSDSTFIEISSSIRGTKDGGKEEFKVFRSHMGEEVKNIEKYFSKFLAKAGLPQNYEVVDSSIQSSRYLSIPFVSHPALNQYTFARFDEIRSYLFRKIIPSFLMSSILFGMIALSFFMINKTLRSQRKLNEMKAAFVSNMTHELKTPIATVGVALEALSDFGAIEDVNKRKEYLDISKHELNRLEILVDKVMQMSNYEGGDLELERESVDLKTLIEQIIKSMDLHFVKNDVSLDFESYGDDFTVHGDPIHLTNVIYNLMDNAIKYSGQSPEISLNLNSSHNMIRIAVSDKGEGISKEYISKIFDRFFRVPSQDTHDVKGHGIGLHYVKEIIEKHQGTIRVESKIDEGTTFFIKIPTSNE